MASPDCSPQAAVCGWREGQGLPQEEEFTQAEEAMLKTLATDRADMSNWTLSVEVVERKAKIHLISFVVDIDGENCKPFVYGNVEGSNIPH